MMKRPLLLVIAIFCAVLETIAQTDSADYYYQLCNKSTGKSVLPLSIAFSTISTEPIATTLC